MRLVRMKSNDTGRHGLTADSHAQHSPRSVLQAGWLLLSGYGKRPRLMSAMVISMLLQLLPSTYLAYHVADNVPAFVFAIAFLMSPIIATGLIGATMRFPSLDLRYAVSYVVVFATGGLYALAVFVGALAAQRVPVDPLAVVVVPVYAVMLLGIEYVVLLIIASIGRGKKKPARPGP